MSDEEAALRLDASINGLLELAPEVSAQRILSKRQRQLGVGVLALILVGCIVDVVVTCTIFVSVITIVYVAAIIYRLAIFRASGRDDTTEIVTDGEARAVPDDELPAVYAAADLFVQPSREAQGNTPIPGYWDLNSSALGLFSKKEKICMLPSDVPRLLHGPLRHDFTCNYPVNEAADGKVKFDGRCQGPHGDWVEMHGRGVYSTTSANIKITGRVHMLGVTLPGSAGSVAHFISEECPPDARHMKY